MEIQGLHDRRTDDPDVLEHLPRFCDLANRFFPELAQRLLKSFIRALEHLSRERFALLPLSRPPRFGPQALLPPRFVSLAPFLPPSLIGLAPLFISLTPFRVGPASVFGGLPPVVGGLAAIGPRLDAEVAQLRQDQPGAPIEVAFHYGLIGSSAMSRSAIWPLATASSPRSSAALTCSGFSTFSPYPLKARAMAA